MKNAELAKLFSAFADILEFNNIAWKPRAYRTAARSIESLSSDIESLYKEKGIEGLKEISGIGEGIAKKIVEFLETGKIREYETLKKKLPKHFEDLLKVPGVGIKKAKVLYQKLGITSLQDLEKAAQQHKIQKLESFKEKTEENILRGISLVKKGKERILLGNALPLAQEIKEGLEKIRGVEEVVVAGSIRRGKETIRDIDILVIANGHEEVMRNFTSMVDVKRVLSKGSTKSSILLKSNVQIDLRIISRESYGSALQYFTGSKEHSIHLRKIALQKELKLSEYGVFKGKKMIAGKTEKEVYAALGLPYIEPELRENRGEIEAALKRKLPSLVTIKDIRGIFHVHTDWSDGANSLQEMVEACKNLNYKYVAICDHGGPLRIANGLDEKRLIKQMKEIDKLNDKISGITVLKGSEVEIMKDGNLGIDKNVLKQLDVVIGSVHSGFKSSEKEMTQRISKAFDNPYLHILGHPTGRIIHRREPYAVSLSQIFEKARERNIALEIDAYPDRLDLSDGHVRDAVDKKVKLAIGADAHAKEHLAFFELGVSVARRGWAEKKDVINCLSLKELEKFLKR